MKKPEFSIVITLVINNIARKLRELPFGNLYDLEENYHDCKYHALILYAFIDSPKYKYIIILLNSSLTIQRNLR
jgi:hypothetical protein